MDATILTVTAMVIAALPPTIAALAALRQGQRNEAKADAGAIKTAELVKKTDEIHVLANSNLQKVTAALEVANQKIEGFEKLLAEIAHNRIPVVLAAEVINKPKE